MSVSAGCATEWRAPLVEALGLLNVYTLEVYRNNFWMMLYGSGSPKRTTVWSNRKVLVMALVGGSQQTCRHANFLGQGASQKERSGEKDEGQDNLPVSYE